MLKKILAFALAGAMVIATMNMMAFADTIVVPASPTGALLVNGNLKVSGLDKGDKVTYYQVVKWDTVTNADGTVDQNWAWGKDIKATGSTLTADDLKAVVGNGKDGTGVINADMASKIAQNATGGTATAAITGTEWTATVTDPGLYMVIVEPATPGTMYNPIFVAANWYGDGEDPDSSNEIAVSADKLDYSDKAMAKKSTIPLNKTSTATDTDNNLEGSTNMSYTADVDEPIDFTITSTVPKFGENYINPVFKLTDNLDGLGMVANTVTVTKEDGTALPADSYKIGTYAEGATSFTVTFDPDYLRGLDPFDGDPKESIPVDGQKIKITYRAKVTDDAKLIVNQETNTVDLQFSTKPDDETGKGLLRDQTNHFTFSIDADLLGHDEVEGSSTDAIKVGRDAEGNYIVETSHYEWSDETHGPLEGAEFKLYKDADCTQLYTNPVFNGTVVSDGTGRINIKGLDAGTYYLKETKAPTGYIKMQDVVEVKITATIDENVEVKEETDADGTPVTVTYITNSLVSSKVEFKNMKTGKVVETSYSIELSASSALAVKADRAVVSSDMELANTKGVELPSTGGIGTTLFYAGGAVLVLLAGVLLVSKRRIA